MLSLRPYGPGKKKEKKKSKNGQQLKAAGRRKTNKQKQKRMFKRTLKILPRTSSSAVQCFIK